MNISADRILLITLAAIAAVSLCYVLYRVVCSLLFRLNRFFRVQIIENPRFQLFGKYYSRLPITENLVALTFDDGPYEPYTTKLLGVLDDHQVKATFFFAGLRIEQYSEAAKEVCRRGHQIGNHSYSHHRLVGRSLKFIRSEIEATDRLIRALGVTDEIPFRAPYTAKFLTLPYFLTRTKRLHILFDTAPMPRDTWGAPVEAVAASIAQQARPGSIIALHDGNLKAGLWIANYTDAVIRDLKKKGFRFCTVSELINANRN